jgi:transcriptional regulator with XRE-family HTH domain/lipopolysaccharide biosynthesis regulator YciM
MLIAFGKYLKILRDRRKLSLSDVATLTKSYPEPVGKGYLSRVERGLARVGFSKMVALSRAYDVSLDALGEKLSLDLEVDELKNAPVTSGKTFGELTEEGIDFNQRGFIWHCYATIRDALPRAGSDPLHGRHRTHHEQVTRATLSHGIAARATGRYALAVGEFDFVREHLDALSDEAKPIVFQQSAIAKQRLGAVAEANLLADQAIELAKVAPEQKHLGDALETRGLLAAQATDHGVAITVLQEAFAAYKAVDRRVDCARTLNNLAQSYFELRRFKAARTALGAADRLATQLSADAIRARSRILLGEIEALEGNGKRASALWHDAIEIARRTRDTVAHFKAEFQLFKLSIGQGNLTAANALGRRLNRMTPWISRSEPEIAEFVRLFAIHRKPKQRGVAKPQL